MSRPGATKQAEKPGWSLSLSQLIVIGLIVGVIAGYGANKFLSHEPTIVLSS